MYRKTLRTIGQVLLLIVISKLSALAVQLLHLPIPGSVAGIAVLFTLLKTKLLRIEWVDAGAAWLLAEMLLFFIPSTVGIVNYKSLIVSSGPVILLAIIGSTVAVMLCAGMIAQRIAPNEAAVAGAVVGGGKREQREGGVAG
ncbi:CidA/LrgA family holin-like protein [Paenibacillus radicis (ex Gao et al. 2016)]|uniref:Holin-like protein CidA n=1 Tax=Paenibacillus radicis (ex Gao et al. 2016) TaxID=1737354 RepID=A0A917M814_9BACL|nr:CidA/LrgA family holin-like protein [Paenibacillus radicis (ex Gao et al. 2016)]GGG83679.1 holin-like protein CidA [Paenibacillus radicis (ex Gao et al. 2016)]